MSRTRSGTIASLDDARRAVATDLRKDGARWETIRDGFAVLFDKVRKAEDASSIMTLALQKELAPAFIAALTNERSALVSAVKATLTALVELMEGALKELCDRLVFALLKQSGSGNGTNAAHACEAVLMIFAFVPSTAFIPELCRVRTESTANPAVQLACTRALNIILATWPDEAVRRMLAYGSHEAEVQVLMLGHAQAGNEHVRRLARVNFRLLRSRFPSAAASFGERFRLKLPDRWDSMVNDSSVVGEDEARLRAVFEGRAGTRVETYPHFSSPFSVGEVYSLASGSPSYMAGGGGGGAGGGGGGGATAAEGGHSPGGGKSAPTSPRRSRPGSPRTSGSPSTTTSVTTSPKHMFGVTSESRSPLAETAASLHTRAFSDRVVVGGGRMGAGVPLARAQAPPPSRSMPPAVDLAMAALAKSQGGLQLARVGHRPTSPRTLVRPTSPRQAVAAPALPRAYAPIRAAPPHMNGSGRAGSREPLVSASTTTVAAHTAAASGVTNGTTSYFPTATHAPTTMPYAFNSESVGAAAQELHLHVRQHVGVAAKAYEAMIQNATYAELAAKIQEAGRRRATAMSTAVATSLNGNDAKGAALTALGFAGGGKASATEAFVPALNSAQLQAFASNMLSSMLDLRARCDDIISHLTSVAEWSAGGAPPSSAHEHTIATPPVIAAPGATAVESLNSSGASEERSPAGDTTEEAAVLQNAFERSLPASLPASQPGTVPPSPDSLDVGADSEFHNDAVS